MNKIFSKLSALSIFIMLFIAIFLLHIDIVLASLNSYFSGFDLKDLNYFINIRQYAFDCLLSGIFPLWTTKLFCGIPFFANSETAIFYFPNIIFYFLSVSKALNFSFLLHFVLFSFGVFLWINNKIKDKLVSFIVALLATFVSPFYLHSCAGHLSNIITVCWFPFLLYFYDKTYEKKSLFFIFPISFIISLQIFAGHFQYVYYSALFSLIYIVLFCRNKYSFITIFVSYFISLFLTAVQFLPSIDFYFEGARRLGVLSHFSLYSSLKYLLTILFPITISGVSLWFWETSLYIGIFSLFVILLSIVHIKNKDIIKYVLFAAIIYVFSFKFFANLANYVIPFFSSFRSPIKFNFFIILFLLPVLAHGLKYIFSKDTKINKYFILSMLIASLGIALFKNNIVLLLLVFFNKNIEFYKFCLNLSVLTLSFFIVLFCSLLLLKKYSISKIILVFFLIAEPIFIMRFCSRPFIFNNDYKYEYTLRKNFNEQVRFFSNDYYNLKYNAENLSGSTPDALYNYLHFMDYLKRQFNETNFFGLLRCKYLVDDKTKTVSEVNVNTLNRLNVMYSYKIQTDKEKIYEMLSQNDFDIFNTVILEKQPKYETKNKGEYKLNIINFDENSIEFECYTTEPAIILYTDNYSNGWYAYNINNLKEKYEILCADYIYKAISVNAGNNKIRIEYKPKSFFLGVLLSSVSWILFILLFYVFIRKNITKQHITK